MSHQARSRLSPECVIFREGSNGHYTCRSSGISAGADLQVPITFLEASHRVFVQAWLAAETDVIPGSKLVVADPITDPEWRFHLSYVSMHWNGLPRVPRAGKRGKYVCKPYAVQTKRLVHGELPRTDVQTRRMHAQQGPW